MIKISLAELSSLPHDEKLRRINELMQSAMNPSHQFIDEWLKKLNSQIHDYERKYNLSSDEMRKMVADGQMPETIEICSWLNLLNKKDRFESKTRVMNQKDLLNYEIAASWWACYVSHPALQSWIAKYFAWKVNRKYQRYQRFQSVKSIK